MHRRDRVGHNIWAWDWPVFVTLAGWDMTVIAIFYMLLPATSYRMIDNADRWQELFSWTDRADQHVLSRKCPTASMTIYTP